MKAVRMLWVFGVISWVCCIDSLSFTQLVVSGLVALLGSLVLIRKEDLQ